MSDIESFRNFIKNKIPEVNFPSGMLFGVGGMDTYSKERFAQEIRKHLQGG